VDSQNTSAGDLNLRQSQLAAGDALWVLGSRGVSGGLARL